jgi:hypothetical protein
MKSLATNTIIAIAVLGVMAGLLIPLGDADARIYGFSAGSFRRGAYAEGVRGGEAIRTPYGGAAVRGPEGAAAIRNPYGGAAVRGPEGNVAVGRRVTTLPATASRVFVGNRTYYVDHNVYYEPYFDGAEVTYVVVPPP